jgi:hypothetical protein
VNRLSLIGATDGEWDAWIESTTHDVYHTAAYHRVAAATGEGTPQLLIWGDRDRFVAWPYLLQAIPGSSPLVGGPAHDVTSTYGYSGPLVRGCDAGDPMLAEAWRAFTGVWREQHVVSVFTRFHPILANHRYFIGDSQPFQTTGAGLGIVVTGETVSIDVSLPESEVLAGYPRKFRQEIAQSRRGGLSTSVDADWARLDSFLDLYTETMHRNNARGAYFLGRDYFDKLIAELGSDLILFVGMVGDDVAAACLFMSHHGILHPHLAGTSTGYLPMSPLKVMWDDVRQWAKARGDRIIHLGGGRGGSNDSLFEFKARFSPRRHEFYTGRWILDRIRYQRLAQETQELMEPGSGYFPPYRAPRLLE